MIYFLKIEVPILEPKNAQNFFWDFEFLSKLGVFAALPYASHIRLDKRVVEHKEAEDLPRILYKNQRIFSFFDDIIEKISNNNPDKSEGYTCVLLQKILFRQHKIIAK